MQFMYRRIALRLGYGICLGILWGAGSMVWSQPAETDTLQLLQLIKAAQQEEGNHPEKAKAMYRQVKTASEQTGWTTGVLKFYTNYTAVLNQQGRYDSALRLNLESVALAKAANNTEYLIATQINTGTSYFYLNDAPAAISYFLQVLPLLHEPAHTNRLGIVYDNLGNAYDAIRDFGQAKYYYRKALALYRQTEDTLGLCYTSNNLSKTYTTLQQYDSAYALVQQGMEWAKLLNNQYLFMIFWLNQTNIYMHQGAYPQMESPAQKARAMALQLEDAGSLTNACYALAWVKLHQAQPDSAKYYATEGLKAARTTGSKKEESKLLELLAQIALHNGQLDVFDQYNKQSDALADSVLNENIQRTSLALAAKFEAGRKHELIAALEKTTRITRQWNMMLGGVLLLVLATGWLIWRTLKQRQRLAAQEAGIQQARIQQLEQEKKLLASRALLHGQEAERLRLSRELHDGVGSMLSGIKLSLGAMKGNLILPENDARLFAGALNKLDETMQEMRRVAHSMMPEALLKLGLNAAVNDYCAGLQATGKITIRYQHYGMEKRLPNDVEIVVYRIIQELFANVLKHAGATEVMIQLMRHEDQLSLTFEDNGKGMDTAQIARVSGAGLGNIRARVDYLHGHFDLRSTPGKGTSAHLEIPLHA